jgi:hypothetical protein
MSSYRVVWARQGSVRWEEWWLEDHGPSRSHIPGLDEHLSFVNFDLTHNGLNPVTKAATGELQIDITEGHQVISALALARDILQDHGFELESNSP